MSQLRQEAEGKAGFDWILGAGLALWSQRLRPSFWYWFDNQVYEGRGRTSKDLRVDISGGDARGSDRDYLTDQNTHGQSQPTNKHSNAELPVLNSGMTYFVYILRTSLNTLYIGQTNNLERRLKEHKDKTKKSAKYVRCFESVELVYFEEQPTRGDAIRREMELRTWTKKKKERLVAGDRI